jgi:hypothetical protein
MTMTEVQHWNSTWKKLLCSPEYKEFRRLEADHRQAFRTVETWRKSKEKLLDAKRAFVSLADWHPYTARFSRRWPVAG